MSFLRKGDSHSTASQGPLQMCHPWACPPPVSLAALGGGFGLGSARVGRRGGGGFFQVLSDNYFS